VFVAVRVASVGVPVRVAVDVLVGVAVGLVVGVEVLVAVCFGVGVGNGEPTVASSASRPIPPYAQVSSPMSSMLFVPNVTSSVGISRAVTKKPLSDGRGPV
jgi:hypothetical protein